MRSGDAGPTAQPAIAGAVAAGGVIGALARHGAGVALPTAAGAFPLTTFAVNVVGCALMGALVAALARTPGAHPLLRPFLGTGVLGGFTTFSAFAVETVELLSGRTVRTGERVTAEPWGVLILEEQQGKD